MVDMTPHKGPAGGHTGTKQAVRWMMKSSNGTQWETRGRYYREEVNAWQCSKPLWPVFN